MTAFSGVRGVGSLYYVAFASSHGDSPEESLWAVVALAVATSVVVHGVLATPVVGWLDRRRSEYAHRTRGLASGDLAVDVHL